MLQSTLQYSNITSSASSSAKEHVAYSSVTLALYALGSVLGLLLVFISCCVIRRKKGRLPKYFNIYISLFTFCVARTAAFALRVVMALQKTMDLGTIIAHNMLFQAGLIGVIFLVQDITLSWIDNCLKRISAFTPKVAKIIRIFLVVSRILLIIFTFSGVGSVGFMISDMSLLLNPRKSVGMFVFRCISTYGNLVYVFLQTLVFVALHAYMLVHEYFSRIQRKKLSAFAASPKLSEAPEQTVYTSPTSEVASTPVATYYTNVKPIQKSIILGTPILVLIVSLLLLTKMAFNVASLHSVTTIRFEWFYAFSVLPELLCVFIIIAGAPNTLYKLRPHRKPKESKKEAETPASETEKSDELPQV